MDKAKDTASAVDWLRATAASYARDAWLLRDEGELREAVVYEAVRDELDACADGLESGQLPRIATIPRAAVDEVVS